MKPETQPDNPPAFPMPAAFSPECGTLPGQVGMTLRDWFAGQALAGDFAAQSAATGEWANTVGDEYIQARAAMFYRFADAMLRAREGKQ